MKNAFYQFIRYFHHTCAIHIYVHAASVYLVWIVSHTTILLSSNCFVHVPGAIFSIALWAFFPLVLLTKINT